MQNSKECFHSENKIHIVQLQCQGIQSCQKGRKIFCHIFSTPPITGAIFRDQKLLSEVNYKIHKREEEYFVTFSPPPNDRR